MSTSLYACLPACLPPSIHPTDLLGTFLHSFPSEMDPKTNETLLLEKLSFSDVCLFKVQRLDGEGEKKRRKKKSLKKRGK